MRFDANPTLLIITSLDLPLRGEADSVLFQVVAQRYMKTSTVITTNRGVGQMGRCPRRHSVAAAVLDKLLRRSVVLNLDGDSYRRLRDHRARPETLRRQPPEPDNPLQRSQLTGGHSHRAAPGGLASSRHGHMGRWVSKFATAPVHSSTSISRPASVAQSRPSVISRAQRVDEPAHTVVLADRVDGQPYS